MSRYALHRKPENPLLDVLVEEREQLGMSQMQLSKKLRRSYVSVHKWERGKSEPSLSNLQIWCDELGFKLSIERKD